MNYNIYFAGLFDGEGCVTIDKAFKSPGAVSPVYRLTVQIAMIDRRPLDLAAKVYGSGGVYKGSTGKLTKAQAYRWCCCAREAASFLTLIRPYSVVKAEEIDIALAFQKHVRSNAGYRTRMTEETLAYREDNRVRLQALKRRFRTHESPGEP